MKSCFDSAPFQLLRPARALLICRHFQSSCHRDNCTRGACTFSPEYPDGLTEGTCQGEYENRVPLGFSVPKLTSEAGLPGHQRAILGYLPWPHLL